MDGNNHPFGYWMGRILAYLIVALITLLIAGGGIALIKMFACYILG